MARGSDTFTYKTHSNSNAINWSNRPDIWHRLAIGTNFKEHQNTIDIVRIAEECDELVCKTILTIVHPNPPKKLMFIPDKNGQHADLLASSSDLLRIWRIKEDELESEKVLQKGCRESSPITSFDWNELDNSRIGTSHENTSCIIWDLNRELADIQIIMHQKEVHDIAWGGAVTLSTVSADGNVRVFDLRRKGSSLILYKSSTPSSYTMRLEWNKQDPRYLAAIVGALPKVVILDLRFTSKPLANLTDRNKGITTLAWAPNSPNHIATGGRDSQILIWNIASELTKLNVGRRGVPFLTYSTNASINQLSWCDISSNWMAIGSHEFLQLQRITKISRKLKDFRYD